jgi:hypothetical protein
MSNCADDAVDILRESFEDLDSLPLTLILRYCYGRPV